MTTKFKWTAALLIALCVLMLLGVGLMIYSILNPLKGDTIIRVELEEGVGQIASFTDLAMVPGSEDRYRILLSSQYEDDYVVTFTFRETEDHGLKNYVYARIEYGDEVIADKLLRDVFEDKTYSLELPLYKDKDAEVKITYYIPESVGNEAERTSTDFDLVIVAANSEEIYE